MDGTRAPGPPWKAALATAVGGFLLYAFTSPGGITWAHNGDDGAEFAAVGRVFGVAHPPGYPLFTLLLRLISVGSREPAWRITLFTNVVAAAAIFLAVLFFAELARRATGRGPGGRAASDVDATAPPRHGPHVSTVAAVIAAIVFAVSPTWWSQANIIEVYALHLFFVALALGVAVLPVAGARAPADPRRPAATGSPAALRRRLWLLAYLVGLGLTHHLQTVLVGPSLLLLVWAGWREGSGREAAAGGDAAAVGGSAPPGAPAPIGNPGLPPRNRPGIRTLAVAAAFLLLPITLYAVLFVRSRLNPPLDWGDPESLRQLFWVMRGQQYRFLMFTQPPADVWHRAQQMLTHLLPAQFAWTALPLGLIGIVALGRRRAWAVVGALLLYMALQLTFALNYRIPDPEAYTIPVTFAWAALCAAGAAALLATARRGGRRRAIVLAALVAMLAGPVLAFPRTWRACNLAGDTAAADYGREAVSMLPRGALVLSEGDGRTFSLWYNQILQDRRDVSILYRWLLVFPWYVKNARERDPLLDIPAGGWPSKEIAWNLLTKHIPRRPVYTNTVDPWYASTFVIAPEGRLFRVRGLRHPILPPESPPPSKPVDFSSAANADYRWDPFTPGSRDSSGLYPGLGGGPVYWGALPLMVARPQRITGCASVITTAGQPSFYARLPLAPEPTKMVVLLLDGRWIGPLSLKLGEARVHYADGPPTVVEVRSYENVWDFASESYEVRIPEDVLAWHGPLNQSLTVLPIPTDPGRQPVALEITGEGPPGESGKRAGYTLFAATQVLLPPGSRD